jgi:hypothetical protein
MTACPCEVTRCAFCAADNVSEVGNVEEGKVALLKVRVNTCVCARVRERVRALCALVASGILRGRM